MSEMFIMYFISSFVSGYHSWESSGNSGNLGNCISKKLSTAFSFVR
ncbi:hypothetical protein [Methanobrevibacter wolinii]|nr:hypothetical protein [Methanobrevibacter wolinii]